MDRLRVQAERVIVYCDQLLADTTLTDLQRDDVERILNGAERFRQILTEYRLSDEYVERLRTEQQYDNLGYISHAVRGPLSSIVGYADMLAGGFSDPLTDAQQVVVNRIIHIGSQLAAAIYDLFDADRKKAG